MLVRIQCLSAIRVYSHEYVLALKEQLKYFWYGGRSTWYLYPVHMYMD